jgi:uncharacterized protein HemY
MKAIWFFTLTTIKGGIYFFFPIFFIGILLQKTYHLMHEIVAPIATSLGIEGFAGKASLTILVILCIILICFIGGLLMKIKQLKQFNQELESWLQQKKRIKYI